MRARLRWLLLAASALLLASCAVPYSGGYYGGYANYAYPDDYYLPAYSSLVFDGGFHHFHHDRIDHIGHHFGHRAAAFHGGAFHGGMSGHGGHGGGHR